MRGPAHLPAEPRPTTLQDAIRRFGATDCHPADQQLLWAVDYLKRGGPINESVWRTLARAAREGDLFIITREAGDSLDRLGRLKRKRPER